MERVPALERLWRVRRWLCIRCHDAKANVPGFPSDTLKRASPLPLGGAASRINRFSHGAEALYVGPESRIPNSASYRRSRWAPPAASRASALGGRCRAARTTYSRDRRTNDAAGRACRPRSNLYAGKRRGLTAAFLLVGSGRSAALRCDQRFRSATSWMLPPRPGF